MKRMQDILKVVTLIVSHQCVKIICRNQNTVTKLGMWPIVSMQRERRVRNREGSNLFWE